MPDTRVRVVGSGFSTFNYRGKPIAFLDSFVDSGQTPPGGAQNYEAITPLGAKHPVEFAVRRYLAEGRLSFTVTELWLQPVWQQLVGLENVDNILDVYDALAATPSDITCQMIVKPPGGAPWRGKVYHGVVITTIPDGENVTMDALSSNRDITAVYTHTTPLRASDINV